MNRSFALALVGFAALSLAAPLASQAQTTVGVPVPVNPGTVAYQPGYTYVAPPYVVPAPTVVAPSVVVAPRVYPGWYWNGYRWNRPYRYDHYVHRR